MFGEILDWILRTNLFNFIIFLSIIIYLYKKFNVTAQVEKAADSVKETIEEAENTKVEAENHLNEIEKSISNLGKEIEEILKESEENANLVGKKILEDSEKTALVIQENTQKAIENSRNILKNDLIKRAATASVEVAKAHIINELRDNQELHDRLINESIEAIEGVLHD